MSAPDLNDAATVRNFFELLHTRAAAALRGVRRHGVLRLVSMAPDDRGMSVSPFNIGDVDHMLETALIDAKAGRNVYVETRTVRPGRPNERGKLEATIAVFALVIDCDADKGRGRAQLNSQNFCSYQPRPRNCGLIGCPLYPENRRGPARS